MKKIGKHIKALFKALPWALSAILLATLVGVLLIPSMAKTLEEAASMLTHIGGEHTTEQPSFEAAFIGNPERLALKAPEQTAALTTTNR